MKKFICITAFLKKKKALGLVMTVVMAGMFNISLITSAQACTPFRQSLAAPASINLNPTLPVGTVVATVTLTWPTFLSSSDCGVVFNGRTDIFNITGYGSPSGNLYATDIPGLAYRGKITAGWPSNFIGKYWPQSLSSGVGTNSGVSGGSVMVEFVKTGPIQPGTFGPQVIMSAAIASTPWFELYLSSPIIVKPTVPACTVTQSAITLNLDDTNTSQLAALGNTSKDKDFNIPLSCSSASNISLAFSGDIVDAANAVFRNLNSSSANAASVGIQILKDNMPVPTTVGDYLNLGPINGSITIPMTARYYALSNNIDVGTVSSIAYATIIYN
ncbi:fimbrial protein [Rahnella woolbedingensis]|uniref:Fimbrial protein n=1 Tax=Rahnella woolbedingensis TaxID=1510574 RepID=A0A419N571_9GAMM|nr:fimbrial protein [Rahnella woolbedingensis]RJT41140.1 fimbrial protein [Rahnella woolbedingensis]